MILSNRGSSAPHVVVWEWFSLSVSLARLVERIRGRGQAEGDEDFSDGMDVVDGARERISS